MTIEDSPLAKAVALREAVAQIPSCFATSESGDLQA
jgi:hypothetical protein